MVAAGTRSGEVDVVVAGAGPAGSATAIALARRGWDVLLADPGDPRPGALAIGEGLPAVAGVALRELGLPDPVDAGVAHRSTGTTALWDGEPLEQDAIRDPRGGGWHLDRTAFDAWLREAARAAGARVLPERVEIADGGVEAQPSGRAIACRRVVDATGRPARIARRRGARHERRDRLVALYGAVRTPAGDVDARTRLEATPSGWWYSARIGDGRRMAAFLTDADLVDHEHRSRAGFEAALAGTSWVLPDGDWSLESAPAARPAHGARLTPPAGEGWLAVGDAALSFDPLSSQGILNALVTGIQGADAVDADLHGDESATVAYTDRLERVWSAYELNRAGAYELERRWPEAPFWARRTGVAVG